jgi:CBS domain-containing protein
MMLRLRDIMTRDVLTLRPDSSLREAIELLSGHHITGAPVVENGVLVGVVSGIDVMDAVAAEQRVQADSGESWANGDDDTSDAEAETASWFTTWEEPAAALGLYEAASERQDGILEELTVADAMTRNLAELPPETEVHEAAAYMLDRGIHRVLVVDDGRLEGLVSTTDFLRLVARRKL